MQKNIKNYKQVQKGGQISFCDKGINKNTGCGFEAEEILHYCKQLTDIGTLFTQNDYLLKHYYTIDSYVSASISSLIYYPPRCETAR